MTPKATSRFRDRPIQRRHMETLVHHFPKGEDVVRFYFTGYSRIAPRIALRLFHFGLSFMPPNSAHGDLRLAFAMTAGLPFALLRSVLAWLRRKIFSPHRIPALCTSVTIEIEVSGANGARPATAAGSGTHASEHDESV